MSLFRLGRGLIRSKLLHTPFSANFKVTERCNLRCPMCSIWRHGSRSRELSLEDITKAAESLKKLGLTRIVLTGGEPFVRKDLPSIVRIFAERGLSVTLLTNGLLARDATLRELFDAGLEHIGISLDYLTPERQDSFYNHPGAWKLIEATIRTAHSLNHRGMVYVMTTVQPDNITEIIPLFRTVQQWGAHFLLNPVMASADTEPERVFSGGSSAPVFSEEQRSACQVLYRELIRLKKQGHRILSSEHYLQYSADFMRTGSMEWHCHAGQLYFNIYSDGGVAPCNEYPAIASVTDDDFVTTFSSKLFQDKAKFIRTSCRGCNFSCWRELSALLSEDSILIKQSFSLIRQRLRGFREHL